MESEEKAKAKAEAEAEKNKEKTVTLTQEQFDLILNEIQTLTRSSIKWLNNDDTALVASTASGNGNYITSVIATRLVINSYSSGATIQYNITVITLGSSPISKKHPSSA